MAFTQPLPATHTNPLPTAQPGQAHLHPAGVPSATDAEGLRPGRAVEVHNRFTGGWSCGFEVTEVVDPPEAPHPHPPCYRIRRTSDGALLPGTFAAGTLRPRR